MTNLSEGEELFALHVRTHKLPPPEREYRFCERRWRFDFAWPHLLVAVEVEGGTRSNGRHNRHAGFQADCEKYNMAAKLGWKVFRYTTPQVKSCEAIKQVQEVLGEKP